MLQIDTKLLNFFRYIAVNLYPTCVLKSIDSPIDMRILTTVVGLRSAPHSARKPMMPMSMDSNVNMTQNTTIFSEMNSRHTTAMARIAIPGTFEESKS